jgi:hypothetical protein
MEGSSLLGVINRCTSFVMRKREDGYGKVNADGRTIAREADGLLFFLVGADVSTRCCVSYRCCLRVMLTPPLITADVAFVSVDSDRQTLYALTHNSQIEVWQMSDNGGMSQGMVATGLIQRAQQCTAASTALDVTKGVSIVSISVVGAEISSNVNLVALTSTGKFKATGVSLGDILTHNANTQVQECTIPPACTGRTSACFMFTFLPTT